MRMGGVGSSTDHHVDASSKLPCVNTHTNGLTMLTSTEISAGLTTLTSTYHVELHWPCSLYCPILLLPLSCRFCRYSYPVASVAAPILSLRRRRLWRRLCRYTLPQFLCVALLTAGAVSATFAEALMGDTAKAAAAAGGGAAAAPCTNCPDAAGPSTAALARQAAATAVAAAAAAGSDAAAAAAAAASASSWYMIVWLIGVGMLAAVLILQACLGNYQSWVSGLLSVLPELSGNYQSAPCP